MLTALEAERDFKLYNKKMIFINLLVLITFIVVVGAGFNKMKDVSANADELKETSHNEVETKKESHSIFYIRKNIFAQKPIQIGLFDE